MKTYVKVEEKYILAYDSEAVMDAKEAAIKALEDVKAEAIVKANECDQKCQKMSSFIGRQKMRERAQTYDDIGEFIDHKIKEIEHG